MCKQKLPAASRSHVVCVPLGESLGICSRRGGGRRYDCAINTTDVMSDPVACYVISGEHGARKKVLDNALPDAAGVFFYTPRYLFEPSVRVPSLWADCVWF